MKKCLCHIFLAIFCTGLFAAPVESPPIDLTFKDSNLVWNHFPLGIYWVPKDSMPEIKAAGFNFVVPIPDEVALISAGRDRFNSKALEYLDKAYENGLKCGFFIDTKDLQNYIAGKLSWERIAEAVATLSSHPALLFYYFRDEPENNTGSLISDPLFLQEFADRIKAIDPTHPTFLVNWQPESFHKYGQIPDIYSIDIYPIPHKPVTTVSSAIDLAVQTKRYNSHLWFTVQGFGNTSGFSRSPTPAELRCMTYLSLVHGATGIQFFRYCGKRWRFLQPMPLWKEIVKITKELNILSPGLNKGLKIDNNQLRTTASIDYSITLHNETAYVIAVNKENRKVKADFRFSFSPGTVEVLFEERDIRGRDSSFTDSFAPYEVHIYKLENYFLLRGEGPLLQVGRQVKLSVMHNLPNLPPPTVLVNNAPHEDPIETAAGWEIRWTPSEWGEYKVKATTASADSPTAELTLAAEYAETPGIWHSYSIRMNTASTFAGVIDGEGRAARIDFYEAPGDNISQGKSFDIYNARSHPYNWNRVKNFRLNDSKRKYPYAGKKSMQRFVNYNNPDLGIPASVFDLAIHPPCGSGVTVTAFEVPEEGRYSVMGLGVRKSAGCGNALFLKLYNPLEQLETLLVSSGTEWVSDPRTYNLGTLEKGNRIYFAVGSLTDCSCDFADIRWHIKREEVDRRVAMAD